MQDLTIAVDDDVLAEAEAAAPRTDTTLGDLVRGYLERLGRENRTLEARRELLDLMDATTGRLDVGFIWNREDAYAGRVAPLLPGHKHPGLRSPPRSG